MFELTDSGGSGGLGSYFFCARPTRKKEPSAHFVRSGRRVWREKRILLAAFSLRPGRIVFLAGANKAVRHSRRTRIRPARSFASVTSILSWWSTAVSSQSAVSASLARTPARTISGASRPAACRRANSRRRCIRLRAVRIPRGRNDRLDFVSPGQLLRISASFPPARPNRFGRLDH